MAYIRGFNDAIFGTKHFKSFYKSCVGFDFLQNCSLPSKDANWPFNEQLNLYIDSAGNHQLGCGVCISMFDGLI